MDTKGTVRVYIDETEIEDIPLIGKAAYAIIGNPPVCARVWDKHHTHIIPIARLVCITIDNPEREKERKDG